MGDEMGFPDQVFPKKRKPRKQKWDVDMVEVYKKIDEGRSVISVANELHIPRRTLYRCHDFYQKTIPESEQRISLTGGRGKKIILDMEDVYQQLSSGESVERVARQYGISTKTIYRHANKNQKKDPR